MKTSAEAVGLLGGSFDPVHSGHIHLARAARDGIPLDRVLFIPAFRPPHKLEKRLTDSRHRLAMLRLALKDLPWAEVDECELIRGGVSYTADTVDTLAAAYPEAELHFIIGSDSLAELHTWRRIRDIARRVVFVVLDREKPAKGGRSFDVPESRKLDTKESKTPDATGPRSPDTNGFKALESAGSRIESPRPSPKLKSLLDDVPLRTVTLKAPPKALSSTRIRELVAEGRPLESLLPEPVAEYVARHGLYRGGS